MSKEIEIEDYCGTITWLCMDDEIEFKAQVYFHFEEEEHDDVVICKIEHIYVTQRFNGVERQIFPDRELSKELAEMVIERVENWPNEYGYQQQLLMEKEFYHENNQ